MTVNATLTTACIPSIQEWLSENGSKPQDPAALGEVVMQSFANYVSQYSKYPFFHRYDLHIFIGAVLSVGAEDPEELWLTARRLKSGDWAIGSPSDFNVSQEYHYDRVIQEATAELMAMRK